MKLKYLPTLYTKTNSKSIKDLYLVPGTNKRKHTEKLLDIGNVRFFDVSPKSLATEAKINKRNYQIEEFLNNKQSTWCEKKVYITRENVAEQSCLLHNNQVVGVRDRAGTGAGQGQGKGRSEAGKKGMPSETYFVQIYPAPNNTIIV